MPSSLAKGYDPLYSSSSLASFDGFSRSHSDVLYVMQLVVAATKTTGPIGTKLSRNVPWMVLYKVTLFRSSQIFSMAARANNML
jgi:hypothetical protein